MWQIIHPSEMKHILSEMKQFSLSFEGLPPLSYTNMNQIESKNIACVRLYRHFLSNELYMKVLSKQVRIGSRFTYPEEAAKVAKLFKFLTKFDKRTSMKCLFSFSFQQDRPTHVLCCMQRYTLFLRRRL